VLEVGVELLVEVVDRVRAVDADVGLVHALDRGVGQVELVLDVADDLLEQVLQRDEPLDVAVLVDDDREMLLLAPKVGQERSQVLRLRHDVGGAHDRLEADRCDSEVVDRGEEVTHVQDADDVVERVPVHGIAREGRVHDGSQRLLRGHLRGDRDDIGPRDHHGRDLLRREVEDLVEHLLLRLLELADVLGGRDGMPDVLTGVRDHSGRRGCHAERAQCEVRRYLQQPGDRVNDAAQHVERDGEHRGYALGAL
jgi:hypothetical protein